MSEAVYDTKTLQESDASMFRSLGNRLQPPLLKALTEMGYEYMTPVQQKVLTELPSNASDCLVQAKTGTGKTIAFLLPAIQNLLSTNQPLPRGQVGILILSPTRELALQIAKECDRLTNGLKNRIECHTAFGGTARASNLNKFNNGNPTILVATPGRLNDYLGEEDVRAKFLEMRTLILDEADRMLDQGFLPDIKKALRGLPPKANGWQGMCFSATIPPSIKDVLSVVLNPGYTHLSTVDANEVPTIATVPQYVVTVPQVKDTFAALFALIKQECATTSTDFKAIIFGTTANGVALLHALFTILAPAIHPDIKVLQLHSRLSQAARTRTTEEFKKASSGLMFASDVIGRGIDFPNVGLVIQLGLPANADQYIHRVGRTARAGKDGLAVIVLTDAEAYFVNVNRKLPIQPYPTDLMPETLHVQANLASAFDAVDETTKAKAYQAFLGFNKSFVKNLRTTNAGLVAMANEYADAMQCPETPMVDKKIVGKMGLKGVPGLRVGTVDRDAPPRRKPNEAGTGGPKPRGNNTDAGASANGRKVIPSSNRDDQNGPPNRGRANKRRGNNGGDNRPLKK